MQVNARHVKNLPGRKTDVADATKHYSAQATDLASKTAPKSVGNSANECSDVPDGYLRARARPRRDPVPVRHREGPRQRCLRRTLERAEPRDWPP